MISYKEWHEAKPIPRTIRKAKRFLKQQQNQELKNIIAKTGLKTHED